MRNKIAMTLYRARRQLTTREIAKRVETTWKTAKKYLEVLYEEGIVTKEHLTNRIYWKVKDPKRSPTMRWTI